jgi:hypothetical protein
LGKKMKMFYKIKIVTILLLFTALLGSAYADIDSLREEGFYSKSKAEHPVVHSCSVIAPQKKDYNYIHIYNLKARIVKLRSEWYTSVKEVIEEKNYCEDTDVNMQWEILIQKHPGDMQIHALHALRLGLCFKVDRGDLSVDQATDIFENMRSALISAKEREREEELENDKSKEKNL